jgi:hypothetical protein
MDTLSFVAEQLAYGNAEAASTKLDTLVNLLKTEEERVKDAIWYDNSQRDAWVRFHSDHPEINEDDYDSMTDAQIAEWIEFQETCPDADRRAQLREKYGDDIAEPYSDEDWGNLLGGLRVISWLLYGDSEKTAS